jgi:hypothetical protein
MPPPELKPAETEREMTPCKPDEQDFVNSGLEDTMVIAYQKLREIWKGDSATPDLGAGAFQDQRMQAIVDSTDDGKTTSNSCSI